MPEHWEIKRGDWVFEYYKETVRSTELDGKDIFLYSIPVVQEKGTGQIEEGKSVGSNKLCVQGGELLVSKLNPHKATITLVNENHPFMVCSSEFVPLQATGCDRKFAYYLYLSSLTRHRLLCRVTSATRSHQRVNPSDIHKLWNAFPPLDEQRALAAYLDRKTQQIDMLVARKERLIELLEERRTAVINRAVTKGLDPDAEMQDSGVAWLGEVPAHWDVTKLKWITSKIGSGLTPRGGSTVYQDEGVLFLRSQNVRFNGLDLEDAAHISEEIHASMEHTAVESGDVLINITGASIGRCACVPAGLGTANVNQHVCIVRPTDAIASKYLQMLLASRVGQYQVFSFQDGSSREGLNFSQLGGFSIPLPERDEQEHIVRQVRDKTAEIDSLIRRETLLIEKLKELRTSLISEVVTGKIDVRGEAAPGIAGNGQPEAPALETAPTAA